MTLLAAAAAGGLSVALLASAESAASGLAWTIGVLLFATLLAGATVLRINARRIDGLRAEMDALSLATHRAMLDLARRGETDAVSVAELKGMVARELATLRSKALAPELSVAAVSPAAERSVEPEGNVVPYPQSKIARKAPAAPVAVPARLPEPGSDAGTLIRQALAESSLDLSLRPIISMAEGAAAGFDVFAHFETGDGDGMDLAPSAAGLPVGEEAKFEALLLEEAMRTARRRLGSVGETMPLHVPVSAAFLLDPRAVADFLAAARAHEPLAKALVLSVPAPLVRTGETAYAALQTISEAGIRIAVDDLPQTAETTFGHALALAFVKASARRLLEESHAAGDSGLAALANAAGTTVIAVDVESDEEAIQLIDLGVNLMSGPRFSGPRRLRPEDDAALERISRISG